MISLLRWEPVKASIHFQTQSYDQAGYLTSDTEVCWHVLPDVQAASDGSVYVGDSHRWWAGYRRLIDKQDAAEVTGYGEPFGVSLLKITVRILQDDVIKYANFHFWNKQLSETTTLPYFVLERCNSQEVILESWCSVTVRRAYITRSHLWISSNLLARMLYQKPGSFSCLMNLGEAGGVSMMSTDEAHQWLLLLCLQTSRQKKN